mmetsp:Transcript_75609/g.231399  ORF Transcript_75609/g.231399 Transcript_75609/m.231399 type:complete len:242 (-) Transcript_75609:1040-1765(-)
MATLWAWPACPSCATQRDLATSTCAATAVGPWGPARRLWRTRWATTSAWTTTGTGTTVLKVGWSWRLSAAGPTPRSSRIAAWETSPHSLTKGCTTTTGCAWRTSRPAWRATPCAATASSRKARIAIAARRTAPASTIAATEGRASSHRGGTSAAAAWASVAKHVCSSPQAPRRCAGRRGTSATSTKFVWAEAGSAPGIIMCTQAVIAPSMDSQACVLWVFAGASSRSVPTTSPATSRARGI